MINYLKKFYNSREEVINFLETILKCYLMLNMMQNKVKKSAKRTILKILIPNQRLPIALAQVRADSNSESLLNEIRHIFYSLHQSKQVTRKVYNNKIKSIQFNSAQI